MQFKPSMTPSKSTTSKLSFTTARKWRDSRVMDELDEEEQLQQIYNTSKNKRYVELTENDDMTPSPKHAKSSSISTSSSVLLDKNWRQIKIYIICKSIVWLFIGIAICFVNINHEKSVTHWTTQQFCCQCYGHAINQKLLPIHQQRRIDLSYCTKCIDCTECAATNYTTTTVERHKYHDDADCNGADGFYKNNECSDKYVSDSTMGMFYKNYNNYGGGALIVCLLYVAICLFGLTVEKSNHYIDSIGMLLMIYNVVVAMVCFYMIYKPYQYQIEYISDDKINGPYCFKNTISESMEGVITAFLYTTLGLLALQWIFCLLRCWTKKRKRHDQCSWIYCLTSGAERYYIYITLICGFGFFITMIIAVGYLLQDAANNERFGRISWLIIIDIVLLICCVDIFCLSFCKGRVKLCCTARWKTLIYKITKEKKERNDSNYKEYNKRSNFDSMAKESLLTPKSTDITSKKNTITPQIFEGDENFSSDDDVNL